MEMLSSLIELIRVWIWGPQTLLLFVGVGIYMTYCLRGVQFRYLGYALRQVFSGKGIEAQGDITPFAALMTTLAGAIGTGAIVGVSTGVAIGGLGSLFWMWVTAILGMATKYSETLLAVKYRVKDKRGEMIGGPMEYMERGLGKKWRWVAILFAVCGTIAAVATGNLVQANSISEAINSVWHMNPWITGSLFALATGLVLVGGVRSIGHIAAVLVPIMSVFYLGAGCYILFVHFDQIPLAFLTIIKSAFYGQAAVGGFVGSSIIMAMQMGVARGVFSNESGLGLSTIAAAAAQTNSPGRQALMTMTGTFMSTLVVCTITGLVLAVTGVLGAVDETGKLLNGASMAIAAFNSTILGGEYIIAIGLVLFAFTTVIAWAYYGEKCCEYLFGERSVVLFRIIYTLLVIPGAVMDIHLVWACADITNALMAIPNLIAVAALSKVVIAETKVFIQEIGENSRETQHGMA